MIPASPKQHDFIAGLAATKAIPVEAAKALFEAARAEAFTKDKASALLDSLMGEADREIPVGTHVAPEGSPWAGQRIVVKRSKSRGRLYSTLTDGEYLNGQGLFLLDESTLDGEAPNTEPPADLSEGIHMNPDGDYVKVVRSGSGNLYGLMLNDAGKFKDYRGKAGLAGLSADTVLDAEQAAAFGKQWGMCVFCGRTLTDDGENKSLDVGYGPQCAEKNGLPWG